jgi:phospholipid/cholesterol/gamma-HCH transport system substrate-binding protein
MKKESGSKWKVGLFVTAGFVLFLSALYYIGKQKNLFTPVFRIHSVFSNVAGLKTGSNVRFGGINVGTIEEIQLISDTSVNVVMTIQRSAEKFIKKDATVTIGSDGLMGDKVIVISPGTNTNQAVEQGAALTSVAAVDMDQILGSLKLSADHAAVITDELAKLAYRINHGNGTISRLIGDSSMAENINKTLTNLKRGSQGLDENMEAAKHNFLLKGYFKKKKKQEDEKKKEEQAQKQQGATQ